MPIVSNVDNILHQFYIILKENRFLLLDMPALHENIGISLLTLD